MTINSDHLVGALFAIAVVLWCILIWHHFSGEYELSLLFAMILPIIAVGIKAVNE